MKGRSILEASLVFTVYMAITSMVPGVRSLMRWETRNLGGSYFLGVLMVVLTVVATIVSKLDFEEIGVSSENWRRSLAMGYKGFVAFLVPQFLITNFWGWGIDYKDYMASALFLGLSVLVFAYLLSRNIGYKKGEMSRLGYIVIGLFLISTFFIGFTLGSLSTKIMLNFIWHILVGGLAEELLFRGYIQSTVNREYGTNWKVNGINVGPGLLVSATFYGLSRGLRTMNISWTLFAFTVGIFYGLIREASGDIIGSGSANALIDAIGSTLLKFVR